MSCAHPVEIQNIKIAPVFDNKVEEKRVPSSLNLVLQRANGSLHRHTRQAQRPRRCSGA